MKNLCNCPNCQTNDCPAAAEIEALQKKYDDAFAGWKSYAERYTEADAANGENCKTIARQKQEIEALHQQLKQAQHSAKAWETTAALTVSNGFFYRDVIVKIAEPFGIAAKTSDDGSIQEDVLILKVPELVDSLRAEVAVLKHDIEAYRGVLGYSIAGPRDGKLSNGETPQCGLCNSEHRKKIEHEHNELIMAVARKFPSETRYQTALRYIQEAEAKASSGTAMSAEKK